MPVIFRYKGCRFFFYSNEGVPREPLHVHVRRGTAVAKVWLEPTARIASSYGFLASELNELLTVAIENKLKIKEYWDEHLG